LGEAHLGEPRDLVLEVSPPAHPGMLVVPGEELDLQSKPIGEANIVGVGLEVRTMSGFCDDPSGPRRIECNAGGGKGRKSSESQFETRSMVAHQKT
jgi:hypothetical protein